MTAKGGTDYRVKMKLKIPDSLARDPAVFHGMAKRSKQTIEKFATEGLKTTKKKANWKTYFDAFYAILMPAILQSEAERFEGIEELKGMLDEILSKFTLKGEEGLYPKSASEESRMMEALGFVAAASKESDLNKSMKALANAREVLPCYLFASKTLKLLQKVSKGTDDGRADGQTKTMKPEALLKGLSRPVLMEVKRKAMVSKGKNLRGEK